MSIHKLLLIFPLLLSHNPAARKHRKIKQMWQWRLESGFVGLWLVSQLCTLGGDSVTPWIPTKAWTHVLVYFYHLGSLKDHLTSLFSHLSKFTDSKELFPHYIWQSLWSFFPLDLKGQEMCTGIFFFLLWIGPTWLVPRWFLLSQDGEPPPQPSPGPIIGDFSVYRTSYVSGSCLG